MGPRHRGRVVGVVRLREVGEPGPGEGFEDALCACAALLLSRNAQGVRVGAAQVAESLDVPACARVVAACQAAWSREVERLEKAWSCPTTR